MRFSIVLVLLTLGMACVYQPEQKDAKAAEPSPEPEQLVTTDAGCGPRVWYLGVGWAVEVGEKLLIFDYSRRVRADEPSLNDAPGLKGGNIDPAELQDYDTYVFVTHAQPDHWDPVIYTWEDTVDRITYIFGWEPGNNPRHHYMAEERCSLDLGDVVVHKIYSHHSGVPEAAFLVKVDGTTIYYNGDYKADYEQDYAYLRTLADCIDLAFVIGVPDAEQQYFKQVMLLDELFPIAYMFPMNSTSDLCRQFARLFAAQGGQVKVLVPALRGESFACPPSTSKQGGFY